MARRKRNAFNKSVIEALLYTPFMIIGPTKRNRKSAAKKWIRVINQASK